MAAPRVFVSSTCYDIAEVRGQLRDFIDNYGFEPVMSEYGDIFYDYEKHIQDSCKDEINRCQLFILIIGNNFGSFYHRQSEKRKTIPESVTMQEFRRALETRIPKHIFINHYVNYDYQNFMKALNENYERIISKHSDNDSTIDENVITAENNRFKEQYNYPNSAYRFIFNFIKMLYELKENNAIIPYQHFDDIKNSLRKQWAGFMYEQLVKPDSVQNRDLIKILERIERIDNKLNSMTLIPEERIGASKISFDINKIKEQTDFQSFQEIKKELNTLLEDIIFDSDWNGNSFRDFRLSSEVSGNDIKLWLDSLINLSKKYIWADYIGIDKIFDVLPVRIISQRENINYKTVQGLSSIYQQCNEKLAADDFNILIEYVTERMNEGHENQVVPDPIPIATDDLPF